MEVSDIDHIVDPLNAAIILHTQAQEQCPGKLEEVENSDEDDSFEEDDKFVEGDISPSDSFDSEAEYLSPPVKNGSKKNKAKPMNNSTQAKR